MLCRASLPGVVLNNDADQNIGIGDDPHRPRIPAFAPAFAMVSLISSTVATLPLPLPLRKPKMDSIEAIRRAAFSSALPWGNRFSSIFSPGLMPRCFNTSLRKVTCPRAVTVRVAIRIPPTYHDNAYMHYSLPTITVPLLAESCQGNRNDCRHHTLLLVMQT